MILLLTLIFLVKSVLSLPATPSVMANDDVKVMKCVVEALADVLSRPRPLPVSQRCLHTLRTDDRLVTLLRHYDFLKELQDVATQGEDERGGTTVPHHMTSSGQNADSISDGSMLKALGGPGERSILAQEQRSSQDEEDGGLWMADEKREEDAEREAEDKNAALHIFTPWGSEEEDEEGMKKRSKGIHLGKKSKSSEEARHHSEEVSEEEGPSKRRTKKRNRSPEEKELQMMAGRTPEDEDGSAARRTEEAEAENLAAIESELENVSHKIQQLRRG